MIATSFIEQTWLFSTLLVVVAFAAAFQLLASDKQSLSAIIRIGLFVASGLLLIISAWIDMWLAMILGPWRTVQDQRIPEEVIRITNGLANVSVYPFFV